MYFKQLDLKWSTVGLSANICKGNLFMEYGPLKYYMIDDLNDSLAQLKRLLRPDDVKWAELSVGGTIIPHKDHGLTCTINFYVRASGGMTMFYDAKPEAQPYAFKGKTTANLYKPEDLTGAGLFVARDGAAIALDVTEIHTVVMPKLGESRQFVQFTWSRLSFDDLLRRVVEL